MGGLSYEVALRKESVDRNVFLTLTVRNVPIVALRKESVDRNNNTWWVDIHTSRSLSARRAWIEMTCGDGRNEQSHEVALRKESVDRNFEEMGLHIRCSQSLSARRAWIEILKQLLLKTLKASLSARRAWIEMIASANFCRNRFVALRKESVDRNSSRYAL